MKAIPARLAPPSCCPAQVARQWSRASLSTANPCRSRPCRYAAQDHPGPRPGRADFCHVPGSASITSPLHASLWRWQAMLRRCGHAQRCAVAGRCDRVRLAGTACGDPCPSWAARACERVSGCRSMPPASWLASRWSQSRATAGARQLAGRTLQWQVFARIGDAVARCCRSSLLPWIHACLMPGRFPPVDRSIAELRASGA